MPAHNPRFLAFCRAVRINPAEAGGSAVNVAFTRWNSARWSEFANATFPGCYSRNDLVMKGVRDVDALYDAWLLNREVHLSNNPTDPSMPIDSLSQVRQAQDAALTAELRERRRGLHRYRVQGYGCPVGRLNTAAKERFTYELWAPDEKAARLKVYEKYEHIPGGADAVHVTLLE